MRGHHVRHWHHHVTAITTVTVVITTAVTAVPVIVTAAVSGGPAVTAAIAAIVVGAGGGAAVAPAAAAVATARGAAVAARCSAVAATPASVWPATVASSPASPVASVVRHTAAAEHTPVNLLGCIASHVVGYRCCWLPECVCMLRSVRQRSPVYIAMSVLSWQLRAYAHTQTQCGFARTNSDILKDRPLWAHEKGRAQENQR